MMKRLALSLIFLVLLMGSLFAIDLSSKVGFGWGWQDLANASSQTNPDYILWSKNNSYFNGPYIYLEEGIGINKYVGIDLLFGLGFPIDNLSDMPSNINVNEFKMFLDALVGVSGKYENDMIALSVGAGPYINYMMLNFSFDYQGMAEKEMMNNFNIGLMAYLSVGYKFSESLALIVDGKFGYIIGSNQTIEMEGGGQKQNVTSDMGYSGMFLPRVGLSLRFSY